MEVRKREERELVSSNKIREKSYLEVRGVNVIGKLEPTSAFLYLDGGYQTEKDKKLIRYVEERYKLPVPREFIGLAIALEAVHTLLYLLSQMKGN
jgi:hypothetical protein